MDTFEIALNEMRAEIQFFRVALQVFYLNVVSRAPEPLAMLREMKQDVLQALERLPVEPQTAQGDQRMKQMTLMRGENFFQHIEAHMEQVLRSRNSPRTN
jgi:peptide subunit release factor 1 (eRF1)